MLFIIVSLLVIIAVILLILLIFINKKNDMIAKSTKNNKTINYGNEIIIPRESIILPSTSIANMSSPTPNHTPTLNSNVQKLKYIGARYQTNAADIEAIIKLTQKLINDMQYSQCINQKEVIETQKAEIIKSVRDKPVKCSDFDQVIKQFVSMAGNIPMLEKTLIDLWTKTKIILCDQNGNINPIQVEKLLNSLHQGFCQKQSVFSGSSMYIGAYLLTDTFLEEFVKQLQTTLFDLQKLGCKMSKDDIDSLRKQYIDEVAKSPVSCKSSEQMFITNIDTIAKEISYPGFDPQLFKNNGTEIQKHISKNVCNVKGNVDSKMLDVFFKNLYNSVCP